MIEEQKVEPVSESGNSTKPLVKRLLPSDEQFEEYLEQRAFRVPYDGSKEFYDKVMIKHWKECWEWVKFASNNA